MEAEKLLVLKKFTIALNLVQTSYCYIHLWSSFAFDFVRDINRYQND